MWEGYISIAMNSAWANKWNNSPLLIELIHHILWWRSRWTFNDSGYVNVHKPSTPSASEMASSNALRNRNAIRKTGRRICCTIFQKLCASYSFRLTHDASSSSVPGNSVRALCAKGDCSFSQLLSFYSPWSSEKFLLIWSVRWLSRVLAL